MVSRLQIAQGFQAKYQAMSQFSNSDVVLNDDSIYDAPGAVYSQKVIIWVPEDFDLEPAASRKVGVIAFPMVIVQPFTNRKETYDNFDLLMQAIMDEVFTGNGLSAGGLEGVSVQRIRSGGPLLEWGHERDDGTVFPTFLQQPIDVEVRLL